MTLLLVLPTAYIVQEQEDHVDNSDEDSVWYYDVFKILQHKRMVFERDYDIIRYNILEKKKRTPMHQRHCSFTLKSPKDVIIHSMSEMCIKCT